MSINIKNSYFNGSPIIEGNDNDVKINIQNQRENIDWEMIQDELIEVSAQLVKTSQEYKASTEALKSVMCKDEKRLKNVVKKNISSFTSNVFTGVASRMLVDFLKLLMT